MSLALHVIARDQLKDIERIYVEYGKYFDEVCFAVDSKEAYEAIKDCGARVFLYEWDEDEKRIGFPKFDKKRNFLAENTNSQWYLRLDTDDYIQSPELIKGIFDKVKANDIDCVYTKYIYSTDADGNCDAFQWRETIIKKSENHYWKKSIHENILAKDASKFKAVKDSSLVILHRTDLAHQKSSQERNLKFLMDEFNKDKENTDPRTLSYIGKTLLGFGEHKKAIPFFQMLIMRSGWDDDIYYSYISLAKCYWHENRPDDAIDVCHQAMKLNEQYPDAYLSLCEIYIDKQDYKKAVHWGEIGVTKPQPSTMYVLSPTEYTYRAVMNLAMAYLGLGDVDRAKKFYDKAESLAPSNEFIKSQKKTFEGAFDTAQYIKSLVGMISLFNKYSPSMVRDLVKVVPDAFKKNDGVMKIINSFIEPKKWSDKSVVIFCGQAWEEWAPPSTIKGIGGSEEAVIYLSKELVKLGHEVTVYNTCGDFAGEYEGVTYKNFYEFNQKDEFNVVVAWRQNFFSHLDIKANKKFIWMHDVPMPDQFTPDELNTFDKVIVLSQFHKDLLPKHVPEDKVFVSSNGINLPDFNKTGVWKNPKRLIYTSSYDRGIEHLLSVWPEVLKEVPDAELHLFYGWNTYDEMMKVGVRSPEFKDKMVNLMNQPNVFEHGRVGHKQLIRELLQSGIYVYPSHFEEISCISAMKAQACGCVPVVVNYAALKETVKEGIKIEGRADNKATMELFVKELVAILKDSEGQDKLRLKLMPHKDSFGWDKVAKSWSGMFKAEDGSESYEICGSNAVV